MTNEYLPDATEASRPAKNGGKVFDLVPHKDDGYLIVQARRLVLRDHDLDYGARVLFCDILDLSLNAACWEFRGAVTISVTKLAEHLGCGKRSIYDWNSQLVTANHLWISSTQMPNFWDINTYHITALNPPGQTGQTIRQDGMWGNGIRRGRPPVSGLGARGGGVVQILHAEKSGEIENPQQNAPGSGEKCTPPPQNLRRGAAKFAADSRKNCDGEPQSLRRGAAENAAGSRKIRTGPPQKTAHYKKPIEGGTEVFKGKEAVSPPQLSKDWEKKLKKLFPRELEALKRDLVKEQRELEQRSDLDPQLRSAAVLDITHRIGAIDKELYGGKVAIPPKPKPARAAAPAKRPEKPMSEEEILQTAIAAQDLGSKFFTEAQRAALKKAGRL